LEEFELSENLIKAVKRISAGRSIAFFGAGFSHNASVKGTHLPLAKQLAKDLSNLKNLLDFMRAFVNSNTTIETRNFGFNTL